MTKTHKKYARVYVDGYDLSGDARSFDPFEWNFDADVGISLGEEAKNAVIGNCDIKMGTIDCFFNSAAAGVHTLFSTAGGVRNVMVPIGLLAAPAIGDPVWCGMFSQVRYQTGGDKTVGASLELGAPHSNYLSRTQNTPWGVLLHARGAETAVNSVNSLVDGVASSALGAIGYLQIFATNGSCTFSIQHSANGTTSWTTLLTFDAAGSAVLAEAKPTALTATVNRFTRWQIALGTATSVTFAMALCRRFVA